MVATSLALNGKFLAMLFHLLLRYIHIHWDGRAYIAYHPRRLNNC